MLHLRVIAPFRRTDQVVEVLERAPGVTNIVLLPKAARRPEGGSPPSACSFPRRS